MDTSDFKSDNINVFLSRCMIDGLRANKNPKRVLIRAFTGAVKAELSTPVFVAFARVIEHYRTKDIDVIVNTFSNDTVRNTYHWTCTELFDHLLGADIHIISTHLHQGMLGLGGFEVNGTWNIPNILKNYERLRYHLGSPCGIYVDNPVMNQNKMGYYEPLQALGLCAPTTSVDISKAEISQADSQKIEA